MSERLSPELKCASGTLFNKDDFPVVIAQRQQVAIIREVEEPRARAAALLPGAVADGATIARVVFTENSESLEARTWES